MQPLLQTRRYRGTRNLIQESDAPRGAVCLIVVGNATPQDLIGVLAYQLARAALYKATSFPQARSASGLL
jgi:hypothetical protein